MYALTLYQRYGRITSAGLALTIALCAFAYGALLLGAVSHAAKQTTAERQVSSLQGQVSALEGTYLNETRAISPQAAAALGFVAPTSVATVFVSNDTLTLNTGPVR